MGDGKEFRRRTAETCCLSERNEMAGELARRGSEEKFIGMQLHLGIPSSARKHIVNKMASWNLFFALNGT